MNSVTLGCIVPHAPILVPEIGRGEIAEVRPTVDSFIALGEEVARIGPDTLVIVSPPHMRAARPGTFSVNAEEGFSGSFARFRAARVVIEASYDFELIEAVIGEASSRGLRLVEEKAYGERDWGLMVPLYYLLKEGSRLVSIPVSPYQSYPDHYNLGISLREAARSLDRSVVLVASGDLSHRLKPGAPAGFDPGAGEYDRRLVEAISRGAFDQLFKFDPALVERAGEDCLWSACVLAGAMDGYDVSSEVLSYEGPFGVGYMVARVVPGAPNEGRMLQVS